jgi:NAD(P)-dependent dehydrogenase (short-subunit alcohol dehydrogenase family)
MKPTTAAAAAQPVCLVTGAGRGIGHAISLTLAKRGFRVVAAMRRRPETDPFEGAENIRSAVCDVSSAQAVAELFAGIDATEGRLDALVNNAGVITPIGVITETTPDQWAHAIQVNLLGAYHCTRQAIARMLPQDRGTIVDISSGAAHRPLQGWSAYCAAKAALSMFTRSVHEEYGGRGIIAVGLRPGVVDTDMQAQIRASGINPVSQLPRESLLSAQLPATVVAALLTGAAAQFAGQEIDVRDPQVAALTGQT